MLEQYNIQIAVLEKLTDLHGKELNIRNVLDELEYLKHRVRMMEDEVCNWSEFFRTITLIVN